MIKHAAGAALMLWAVAARAQVSDTLFKMDMGSFMSDISEIFMRVYAQFEAAFTVRSIGVQLVMVLTILALSWVLNRPIKRWFDAKVIEREHSQRHGEAVNSLLRAMGSLSFSMMGLVLISMSWWMLTQIGLVNNQHGMYFVHLAEFVLVAFAGLKLLVMLIQGSFGKVYPKLEHHFVQLFWTLVLCQVFGILPMFYEFCNVVEIPLLGEGTTLWSIIRAVISVVIALIAALWLIRRYTDWINENTNLHPNLQLVLVRVGTIGFATIAVLLALDAVGFNLAILSVFGGALGVGIGFGLQKIASNYIAGFIILLDRSLKLGDLIRVNGFEGTVSEINTRYTVVRNLAGIESIVPNENFVTGVVQNLSYSDMQIRGTVEVSVAYDCNVQQALDIMLEIADQTEGIDHDKSNYALVTGFGADGVDLCLGYWVINPKLGTGGIRSRISLEILRRFDEAGIGIPYATRELIIKGEPVVHVKREQA